MKHRPKNRPHLKKSKQRAMKELERRYSTFSDHYPCPDPYDVPEEPSVADMLENGEGNLKGGDRG